MTFTIIFKIFHLPIHSYIKTSIDLLKICLNQSSDYFEKIKKYKKNKIDFWLIYTLLYIWIINTTILSIAFSSLLLETYFLTEHSLTVETLDDIINNPKLYIGGKMAAKQLQYRDSSVYKNIMKRVIDYENKMNINSENNNEIKYLSNLEIIKNIYDRKAILLLNTFWTDLIKSIYPGFNLMESENKYDLLYGYSYISENHPNSEQIYEM